MPRLTPITINWKPERNSPTPVTEQIVNYMCHQISSGTWPIGSRLPSQRTLAESFGVNRSTVIAAINELADYGIIEGLHGAGTRIVSNTWSLMLPGAPDWADYVESGFFKANNATIQTINRMEFSPGITRLGTGEIDPRLFPRTMWRRIASEAASEIDSLGYPPPEGLPVLREAIAAHMRITGVSCTPEQILITSGALQALQMISVSLLSAGSTVIAEAPSYIKSLQVFQSAGMKLAGVPMDSSGINIDSLQSLLDAHDPRRNAILYTIPTNHNPTGITMSETRRHELMACCIERRLPIIEDNAYQDLFFNDDRNAHTHLTSEGNIITADSAHEPANAHGHRHVPTPTRVPTPLKSLDKTGMVITLGSASKTLAPGLRIGWIVADRSIVHRLADVKMQMDYGASVLSQWVYARFLTSGLYDEYLTDLQHELQRRRDAAIETLERQFNGIAHWTRPQGGFYIWLTFNQPVKIGRLFQLALQRGVLLNPGDIYDFEGDNSLRLSYSYTTPEEFAHAVTILANIVREIDA